MAQLRATILVNVTPESPYDPVADYVDDLAIRLQGAAEEVGAFVDVKVEVVTDVETVVTPTAPLTSSAPLPPVRKRSDIQHAVGAEDVQDLQAWLNADHDPGTDADEVDDIEADVTDHAHVSDVTDPIPGPDPFDLIRKRLP